MAERSPAEPPYTGIALRAAERAVAATQVVCRKYRDKDRARAARDATMSALALMRDAYSADEFSYTARAAVEVQIRHALKLNFEFAWRYHGSHRRVWYERADEWPAVRAWLATAESPRAATGAAYPVGFWADVGRLRDRDPTAVEPALCFLEADPWFHRAGYCKERLLDYLYPMELSEQQARRLRSVIMAVVEGPHRREFRRYCRLARKVMSPELREWLTLRADRPEPGACRHHSAPREGHPATCAGHTARWMLAYLDGVQMPYPRRHYRWHLRSTAPSTVGTENQAPPP